MYIVEIKISKNAIPYEYGFTKKEDAESFKKNQDDNASYLYRWSDLVERDAPKWDQFEFIK